MARELMTVGQPERTIARAATDLTEVITQRRRMRWPDEHIVEEVLAMAEGWRAEAVRAC